VTVLYFADTRFPIERANGVQTMATCHALAARGHDVTLVVRPDNQTAPRDPFDFYSLERVHGLTIATIPSSVRPRINRIRFLVQARAMARRRERAVIYTRDLGLAAFLLGLSWNRRSPLVYESHGIAPVVSAEMPRLLGKPELAPSGAKLRRLEERERLVWSSAQAYVTITQALANELEERYGPRRSVFVVPDGAHPAPEEPDDAVRTHDRLSSPPIAGYAGHLYPWKGVDVFVEALSLTPAIRGLVVGGHPQETDRARVEGLARARGIAERLELTGLVRPADVRANLSRASMLVLPNTQSAISGRYTSPLKLFEYLWLGRPIVASDLPAIREVLDHERTALLVPPGDPRALSGALSRLAADHALAHALGTAARRLAPEFTWAKRAARLEAALAAAAGAA
jgi:glycosyltransferase involved in cell wall biosynthesis